MPKYYEAKNKYVGRCVCEGTYRYIRIESSQSIWKISNLFKRKWSCLLQNIYTYNIYES